MKSEKTIILFRHSKSDKSIDFINDIERPLTQVGYADAVLMSDVLFKLKIRPDAIISSTAVRAYSTALVAAANIKFPLNLIQTEHNLYLSGIKKYQKVLQQLSNKVGCVLLTGHNPDMENIIGEINTSFQSKFPTSGIAIIKTEVKQWKNFNFKSCRIHKLLMPDAFRKLKQEKI